MFDHMGVVGGSTEGESDLVCLPHSECELCRNYSVHSTLAIPSVKYPLGFSSAKLSRFSHSRKRRTPIVTLPRLVFNEIAEAFRKKNSKRPYMHFLPGSWVGPITLSARGRLRDVIWSGITPFFSKRLVKAVQEAGIWLNPMPVTIMSPRQGKQRYYYCCPAVGELWSPKVLAHFYERCGVCGEIKKRKGISAVEANHGRVYVKKAWPGKEGILYSVDHMDDLFSDEFVEVASRPEFTGLAFERVGRWE